MTPESLSCPYCNSMVVLPRLPEPDQAIRCPRCQELFSYHGESGTQTQANAPMADAPAEGVLVHGDGQGPAPFRRVSNRAIAQVVLGVMGLMAGIALVFALTTTDSRRQNDWHSRGGLGPMVAVDPAQLSGLRFLPSSLEVIAGIHVAELVDKQNAHRFVRSVLAEWFDIRDLEASLGIKLEDIDHVVVGAQVKNPLHLLVVVQTRRPYDLEIVRASLGNKTRGIHKDKKTLYSFPTRMPGLGGSLWCASEQTLVLGLQDTMKDVPPSPESSIDRFSPPIQKTLSQLKEGTPIWGIGHSDGWGMVLSMLQVPLAMREHLLPKDRLANLSDVRTFRVWVRFDGDEVIFHLEAGCKDAESAKELDKYLAQNWPEKDKPIPILANRPQSQALLKNISTSLKRDQKDDWIILEAKSDMRGLNEPSKSNKLLPRGKDSSS